MADCSASCKTSPAGWLVCSTGPSPLKLAPWIKELKLSGDLLLRYQWDEVQAQEPAPAPGIPTPTPSPSLRNPTPALTGSPNGSNHVGQRSRWRFRLHLNAEFKFDVGFFSGFGLTTTNFSDQQNQTYTGGFQNYDPSPSPTASLEGFPLHLAQHAPLRVIGKHFAYRMMNL
jgi:hypothetical protein